MKRIYLYVALFSAVAVSCLYGCGNTKDDGYKNSKEQLQMSNEKTSDEKTESTQELPWPWFKRGVYVVKHNGVETNYYYIFDNENIGRTYDKELGSGLPFECEQSEDQILFHMGGVDDNTLMMMKTDNDGNIIGTIDGEEEEVFVLQADKDPDTFIDSLTSSSEAESNT